MKRYFTKNDIQTDGKTHEKCSISLVIRKLQIKIIKKWNWTISIRMARIKKTDTTKCWLEYAATRLSGISDGNLIWYNYFRKRIEDPKKQLVPGVYIPF